MGIRDSPGDAWLGIGGMDAAARSRAFAELEECGALAAVAVEGMKSPLYVKTQDLPLLEGCQRLVSYTHLDVYKRQA